MTALEQKLVIIDPRWCSSTVMDLSRTIYDEQVFERMPILADALMDAGCDDESIIRHCQSRHHHSHNCWVLCLLLGKEFAPPVILDWRKAYQALGMEVEYDKQIKHLGPTTGYCSYWPIPKIKGATCNKSVAALREAGATVYTYVDDLDKEVTKTVNRPDITDNYVIHVKATIEADPENANQSANERKKKGCQDITLLERLLLELAYFLATGEHLDVENWTLCSGSRDSRDAVPYVRFSLAHPWVRVRSWVVTYRHGNIRSRSVVSL